MGAALDKGSISNRVREQMVLMMAVVNREDDMGVIGDSLGEPENVCGGNKMTVYWEHRIIGWNEIKWIHIEGVITVGWEQMVL